MAEVKTSSGIKGDPPPGRNHTRLRRQQNHQQAAAPLGLLHSPRIMNTFSLAVACLLMVGAHCAAVYTYGVPAAVHTYGVPAPVSYVHAAPVVHQVVRAPVVAQHKELVVVPHHEHGYTIEQSKVVQPKSTVLHHDPLTGVAYQQTDYHHAPVVTGSRSSVHHSRPGYVAHRTKTYVY
ncbi:uncharacterized protein LOC144139333 [Haemaphysalis longicornis]